MNYLIASFFLISTLFSFSQDSKNNIGIELAYIKSNLNTNKTTTYQSGPGISIGISWLHSIDLFNNQLKFLKTGLFFESKGPKVNSTYYDENGQPLRDAVRFTTFNYLTAPISFYLYPFSQKYFFIEGGGYLSYMTDSYISEMGIYNSSFGEINYTTALPFQPEIFKQMDAGIIIGLGLDINMNNGKHLVLNYKYSYGLVNINDDPFFDSFELYHRSNYFSLSYLFIKK